MPTTTGRGRRKTGPSIEDVARLAGVSAQTVSRVSTGTASVREPTRAKVLSAMDQLGYAPNRAARALRNGTFATIGLVASQFGRTGETLITEAVLDAAEESDYSVTLLQVHASDPGHWERTSHRISQQAIDGLVIIRAEHATPTSLMLPAGLPVAVSDSSLIGSYPSVVADQVQGSAAAVGHLLELGHHSVHHVAGPADSGAAAVRAAAWQRSLEQAGIRPPQVWPGDWSAGSGYEVGKRIAADPSITAVYCANDEMAFGLIRALHERGREVPQDVSVVGFDGIALSEYSFPPLTTVKQDFHRIGSELVRLVLEQLRSKAAPVSGRVLIPTELIIRGTTAPPPR
jgi:DNA-binding LacI/PurR family transcriptional regulator